MYGQERILSDAPKGQMPQVAAACVQLEEIVETGEKLMQELEKNLSTVLRNAPNATGGSVALERMNEPPVGLAQRLNEIAARARSLNDHIRSVTNRLEL